MYDFPVGVEGGRRSPAVFEREFGIIGHWLYGTLNARVPRDAMLQPMGRIANEYTTPLVLRKKQHLMAYQMFGKNNNQCARHGQGYFTMDVGQFARSYVAQRQIDYNYQGNEYGNPDALDYLECTAVEYNDAYVSNSGLESGQLIKNLTEDTIF